MSTRSSWIPFGDHPLNLERCRQYNIYIYIYILAWPLRKDDTRTNREAQTISGARALHDGGGDEGPGPPDWGAHI